MGSSLLQFDRIRSILPSLCAICAVVSTLFFVGDLQGQQGELPQASEVLSKMRAFDDVFEAGFTASGVTPKGSFGVNSPEGRIAWTISVTNGQCAIVESIQDATEPSADYVKRPEWLKTEEDKLGQYTGVVKTRITYFGSEYSSRTSSIELYGLGPDGQPQKMDMENPQKIVLYHPDDSALTLPYKQILWTLGRGYTKFINEVTELAMQEDGTIHFKANGTGLGASINGRWEITVDPSAAYMVRSAKFFRRPDKPEPMAVITTSGTKWENGRCIPETASWEDNYGPGFSKRSVAYTCEMIRSEPDYDLLEMAQKKLYGPYERYTDVIDRRMTPSSIQRYKAGSEYSTLRDSPKENGTRDQAEQNSSERTPQKGLARNAAIVAIVVLLVIGTWYVLRMTRN